MKKFMRVICLVLVLSMLCGACGKKQEEEATTTETTTAETTTKKETTPETTTAETTTEETTTEDPYPLEDGMVWSKLTGLPVKEEIGKRRPICIMISNIKVVVPQNGTSKAVILYETLVEGGITRLMGVFEEFDDERIGSVRSVRHDYVSISQEYDAILVHYGDSNLAADRIKKLKVNNLSGTDGIGSTVFYRDNSIKMPHNAFTSYARIMKGIEKMGYRTEVKDLGNHFTFYHEDTDLAKGDDANTVKLHFSNYAQPYFKYDAEKKLYMRYSFGSKHIDKTTKEQLAFKNIIIQIAPHSVVDKEGHVNFETEDNTGKGYYITNGKCVPITWEKHESKQFMKYYDEDGNLLTINPGKTFIALYPKEELDGLKIEP